MYHHTCPDQSDYRHYSGKYCEPVRANLGSDLPGAVAWCGQRLSPSHQTLLREIQTNVADQCLVGVDFKQEQYIFPSLRESSQAETSRLAIARKYESNRSTRVTRATIEFWWYGVVTSFVATRRKRAVENEHVLSVVDIVATTQTQGGEGSHLVLGFKRYFHEAGICGYRKERKQNYFRDIDPQP